MRPPGPRLASGRDADIFEYGPGLVLRRSREGRSLAYEARAMSYLHAQGYPVPAVEEISEDGTDLVIERVDGPSMVQAISAEPWTVRRHGRVLADLHARLHGLAPAEFLRPAPLGDGNCVLHLDLHPLNVIMGPKGPVVIDWTGAAVGDPDLDMALAWVLMAAGEVPGGGVTAVLLGWGRGLLVDAFLSRVDRDQIAGKLRAVVELKVRDPHMSSREVANMWRVVDRAERPRRRWRRRRRLST
jgi:aminoglycoside phosphotransferase (APT) family kinase protein